MDRQWVEAEKKRSLERAKIMHDEIVAKIYQEPILGARDELDLITMLNKMRGEYFGASKEHAILKVVYNHVNDNTDLDELKKVVGDLGFSEYNQLLYKANHAVRYLDSSPVEFDGDIIITDPCYVREEDNDWEAFESGDGLNELGITRFLIRDTLYGDWGCITYDADSQKQIGEFCADGGMVAVFQLDEVLKYNPNYNDHIEKPWTTTIIHDFKGTVQFIVEHEEGVYGDDTELAGQTWEDYSVHVVGHGINKKTGEPINFYSTQTSL